MFPFLLFFPFLFLSSYSKIIKYIYVLNDEGYHLVTTLGLPCDATFFEINLSSNYSYITPLNYNRTNSTSAKSIAFETSNVPNATCERLKERIELIINMNEEYVIDDIEFLYYNRTFSKKDSLTFAHNIKKKEYSLLHNLYKRGFIEHLRFGLVKRDEERGNFYFGGVPEEVVKNYSSMTLKIEKDIQTWKVTMNKFYIGDGEYNNEYPMKFELSQRKLLLPQKVYEILQQEIFTPYVANKTCFYKQQEELYECSGDCLQYFPNIELILDNIRFSLNGECLYKKVFEVKTYMIGINKEFDEWVIGVPFFEKYPVLFDYENSSMTFYSNTTFELSSTIQSNNSNINQRNYRYILFILLMVIGLLLLGMFNRSKEEFIKRMDKEQSKNILLQDI